MEVNKRLLAFWRHKEVTENKNFFKSIDFNDIRHNTLQGWESIYCGLGHFVIMRKEYYQRFLQLTTGMGKRAQLWNEAFNVLVRILEEE